MRKKVLLMFMAAMSTGFAGAILTVTGTNTAQVGQFFFANVEIAGATDLYAWQFDFDYKLPSQLYPVVADVSVLTMFEGPFLASAGSTFFAPGTDDPMTGTIAQIANTLVSSVPGQSGNGILFTAVFTANSVGPSLLSLSNVILLDSNFNDIPFTVVPGLVNIVESTPPAVTTPESSSLCLFLLAFPPLWLMRRTGLRRHSGIRPT